MFVYITKRHNKNNITIKSLYYYQLPNPSTSTECGMVGKSLLSAKGS